MYLHILAINLTFLYLQHIFIQHKICYHCCQILFISMYYLHILEMPNVWISYGKKTFKFPIKSIIFGYRTIEQVQTNSIKQRLK